MEPIKEKGVTVSDIGGEMEAAAAESRRIAEATSLINQANVLKIQTCEKDLQAVLDKHGCSIQTAQEYINGQPGIVRIVVVSKK